MKELTMKKYYIYGLLISVALIIMDQLTKYFAVLYLKDTTGINIIQGVFRLQYLENRGAAFGMLQGQQTFFAISTICVLIIIIYIFGRIPMEDKFLPLRGCLIVLSAGAVGNFIDRITLNYVVDFLYFELIDFPIFNVADMYVTVTAVVFVVLFLFYYKEEDLDRIKLLPQKKIKE